MSPAEFAEQTAQTQGLPATIEDRGVLATVAALIAGRGAMMSHDEDPNARPSPVEGPAPDTCPLNDRTDRGFHAPESWKVGVP